MEQVLEREAANEITLEIQGLDCADCARQLEDGIRNLEEVREAVLSFATGKLHLTYSGTLDNVRSMVEAHGYRLSQTGEPDAGGEITRKRLNSALLSAAAILAAALANRFWPLAAYPLLLAAVASGGYLTFRRGFSGLLQRRMDMNVLMTVAVTGALLIGEWWEAATVAFLFAASNALETYTTEKNRKSIRSLMDAVPRTAHVMRDGVPVTTAVEEVRIGDEVMVRPGEALPLDGIVVSGVSYVLEAAVTGESLPSAKEPGQKVYAGTLNGNGSLVFRVEGDARDSTLARIVRLVEEAQQRRAPAQQFIDRFARIYTPAVISLAAAIALLGPVFGQGGWHAWLYRGLALLIVACPCALVVSTPVSIVAALTNAARHGVLIKGGVYLEEMGSVKAILFDKTGTLTMGRPAVTREVAFNGLTAQQVVQVAASLESHSEHILAQAVRTRANDLSVPLLPVEAFTAEPGKGVAGEVDGVRYSLGSPGFLQELGIHIAPLDALSGSGETLLALAGPQDLLGAILVSDTLRPESAGVIKELRRMGIRETAMLTGDREETALPVAAALGVSRVTAGLLPQHKEETVRRYREEWGSVAMVGDGINDAPALASANVGIAMGVAGSPTALETADVALMGDQLDKLPFLVGLSRYTTAIIRQNIALALLIKGLAILLVFPGLLTLWLAILADMGASLLVTANGMRLFAYGNKEEKKPQ
jgi:Zn2+/Cd2+-exporting ATPase